MRKHVKRGVVDSYLKKHPDAKARAVSEATGCHVATVQLARKRLGIYAKEKNPVVFEFIADTKPTTDNPEPVVSGGAWPQFDSKSAMQLHHVHDKEIAKLRGDYAKTQAAIYGLSVIVAVAIVAFAFS